MTRQDIYRLLAGTLHIPLEEFNPALSLMGDYKLDSLGYFEIPLLIEEFYGEEITLTPHTVAELRTGDALATFILGELDARNS